MDELTKQTYEAMINKIMRGEAKYENISLNKEEKKEFLSLVKNMDEKEFEDSVPGTSFLKLLVDAERLEAALYLVEKVISDGLSNAGIYNDRGYIKKKMGDYKGALEDYNKSIELDESFFTAYHNRGMLLASTTKRYDEAADDFIKSIENAPQGNIRQGDVSGLRFVLDKLTSEKKDCVIKFLKKNKL